MGFFFFRIFFFICVWGGGVWRFFGGHLKTGLLEWDYFGGMLKIQVFFGVCLIFSFLGGEGGKGDKTVDAVGLSLSEARKKDYYSIPWC